MISILRISKQKGQEQSLLDLDKIKVSKAELETLRSLPNATELPVVLSATTDQGEIEVKSEELKTNWKADQPPLQILDVAVHQKSLDQIALPDLLSNTSETEQLKQQAAGILGDKAATYQQIEDDITNLESQLREIEKFQQMDGIIVDLKSLKEEIDQRVASVQELSARKQTVGSKVPAQVMNLTEEQLQRIRERLQQARVPSVYKVSLKSSINDEDDSHSDKSAKPNGKPFLVLIAVDVLLGLAAFLITINLLVPIISIVVAAVLFFFYSIYRQIPPKREIAEEDLHNRLEVVNKQSTNQALDEEELAKLENMVLQYSQSQIVKGELTEIENQLNNTVGTGGLEELNQQLQSLEADIADLESELNIQNQKWGSVDTLEQRRQLELKRIDRTRLETELISLPNYQDYLQVKTQIDLIKLDMLQAELASKVYSQISGYTSIRRENGQLQGLGNNGDWVGVELTPDQQKHLAIFDTLLNWMNQDVISPILLVNWENSLPRKLRVLFEEYVLQNKEKEAQVIFVDLVD